jgi:putative prophage lambdaLm01, holin
MLTYFGVVAAAWLVDSMCLHAGAPTVAVVVVVGYLSVTELLSILENLQKSNVEGAGELYDLIRKKSGIGTKKEE